jgi:hypothetical protein
MVKLLLTAFLAAIPSFASAQMGHINGSIPFVLLPDTEYENCSEFFGIGELIGGFREMGHGAGTALSLKGPFQAGASLIGISRELVMGAVGSQMSSCRKGPAGVFSTPCRRPARLCPSISFSRRWLELPFLNSRISLSSVQSSRRFGTSGSEPRRVSRGRFIRQPSAASVPTSQSSPSSVLIRTLSLSDPKHDQQLSGSAKLLRARGGG